MAGIYIHIPFCKQKCHYCNFYSTVSLKYRYDFTDALSSEILSKKSYLGSDEVNTIYFGGGTPSMLTIDEINSIIDTISQNYNVSNNVEITLEANPDDLDKEQIQNLKKFTRINRLSIGIQSFFDDDLKYLNRIHNSGQAKKCIENAITSGFDNITVDLIYGIPTLTENKWEKNLRTFFDFGIPHLSSYSLTVESKTALDTLIKKKKIANIDENQSIEHFKILVNESEKEGFIHYEISNFAKEGYYSKHNSIYWLGGHYLGLGPSAHSYNGKTRHWNVMSVKKYCEESSSENIIDEKEDLTIDQLFNEYILTSIRTSWGCDTEHIKNVFGQIYVNHFLQNISQFLIEKKVDKNGNVYTLTSEGKLFADGIASSVFYGL